MVNGVTEEEAPRTETQDVNVKVIQAVEQHQEQVVEEVKVEEPLKEPIKVVQAF